MARSTSSARPTLFRNAIKYRDAGKKPASGRSGSATLTAEALLGKEGPATLDLTAGSLTESAIGTIAKVQVKQFDPAGALQQTSNHQLRAGAVAHLDLPTRARGTRLQVQASVTGIDGNRTDVVTVTETVKLRPDLSVTRLAHAAQALRMGQTLIHMNFRELNGDVGARATCVLEVDGVVVDQALSVWVDAGGEVECVFVHRFLTLGTRNITVRAGGVTPGDYDASNNARSSTIVITEPEPVSTDNDFTWNADILARQHVAGRIIAEGWWEDLIAGIRHDYRHVTEQQDVNFSRVFVGGESVRSLDGPMTVRYRGVLDGVEVTDDQFVEGTDQRTHWELGDLRQDCVHLQRTAEVTREFGPVVATVGNFSSCTSRSAGSTPQDLGTWFSYSQYSSDVTYYADSWSREVGPDYEDAWSFNGTVSNGYGAMIAGSLYEFEIILTAGGEQLIASGKVPVTAEDREEITPYECVDADYEGQFREHSCYGSEQRFRAYTGLAVGLPTR